MRIQILLSFLLSGFIGTSAAADFGDVATSWYFHAAAGGNWAEDLEAPSVSYELKPGYRASIGPGLQIGKYVAIEFETGLERCKAKENGGYDRQCGR